MTPIRAGVTWECDESRADDPDHEWPNNPIGSEHVRFTAVIDNVDDDFVEMTVTRSNPHIGSPDPGAEIAKSAQCMQSQAKWQPYDETDREDKTETHVNDEDCVLMCDGGEDADDGDADLPDRLDNPHWKHRMMTDGGVAAADGSDGEPTHLDSLDAKALTTPMSVLPNGPGVEDAADMWLVLHQVEHVVADVGGELTCDCLGCQHGHKCYHIRRVEFETGRRKIPAWVDRDRIDDQLGVHVDADPVFEADRGRRHD